MGRIVGVGPNWYSNGATVWYQRYPVAVDAVTGTSSGTVDVTFAIPAAWDEFWSNVQDTTTGYDIIVTGADGRTLLSFDLSGFNHATRTCTVRIDGLALVGTGKMEMVWLYWNSAQASNLGAVVTISSAITGYIELGAPPAYWSVVGRPLLAGQTQPSQFVTKDPNGIVHVYWDVTDLLLHRDASAMYNSHTGYEGIDYVTPSAEAGATTAVTGAQTRFVQANDRLYVRSQHTGGSDATTETIYLAVLTKAGSSGSSARTIYCAAQLAVDDAA